MFVIRKWTDVALRCTRLKEQRRPVWSYGLVMEMLKTLAALVRRNGLREYVFDVRGAAGEMFLACEIYLKDPYGGFRGGVIPVGE